ncbi:hypothetical protein WKH57_24980 [Niallia taxi]|uniref:hypothetical protein n=1 Tax=Niallia taxi TaxID=2499688 RepID=UPI0020417D66|nr:hypothetical protein [Niallia taxi]MCM3216788.1 hypothetical protein [Niallia taxi]
MQKKDIWGIRSVILSSVLIVAAIVIFIMPKFFELGTLVLLYLVILLGFIVSFIFGLKSKGSFKIFSIVANIVLFLGVGGITFFLALANGISEP